MAVNLETLSPKELQALISNAESQMKAAHANLIQGVRTKIESLLHNNSLTLADVFPTRGGKAGKGGKKSVVAPKYQNPSDPAQTWSGRGKRPLWFVAAIKKRGVSADDLLIAGATKAAAPAKAPKAAKAPRKVAAKRGRKPGRKPAAKKAAKA